MKVELWQIGKTSFDYLKEGNALYAKRLKRYLSFQVTTLPDVKNAKKLTFEQLRQKEGELVLQKLRPEDLLILLDEKGTSFSSVAFAQQVERWLVSGKQRVVFLIGGAFGFSRAVYDRSDAKISLSDMTFSHQMVRLFFLEQLYRAMTILRNEPYHHND
jgi:23S rRNA (pseudouridine1915-N3)-methyltransferase